MSDEKLASARQWKIIDEELTVMYERYRCFYPRVSIGHEIRIGPLDPWLSADSHAYWINPKSKKKREESGVSSRLSDKETILIWGVGVPIKYYQLHRQMLKPTWRPTWRSHLETHLEKSLGEFSVAGHGTTK